MINWKVRCKNKVWLAAFLGTVVAFVYQVFRLTGYVPSINESEVINLIGLVLSMLTALGVIVDGTTPGIGDSARALEYTDPYDCYDEGGELDA